jgi:pSer/pThr/pTyr-binding forkhead associated (FHA) protein
LPVAVVFLLRTVVLVLLWGFVVAAIVAVRHDVFGTSKPTAAPATPKAGKPAKPGKPPATPKPPKAARRPKTVAAATQLAVLSGPSAGTAVALSSLPVTIGRDAGCSVVLTDDYVSSHHARLVPRGTEWLVEDTGSTNGTFLGDTKVTSAVVVPIGGQIRIGRNVLELRA